MNSCFPASETQHTARFYFPLLAAEHFLFIRRCENASAGIRGGGRKADFCQRVRERGAAAF